MSTLYYFYGYSYIALFRDRQICYLRYGPISVVNYANFLKFFLKNVFTAFSIAEYTYISFRYGRVNNNAATAQRLYRVPNINVFAMLLIQNN